MLAPTLSENRERDVGQGSEVARRADRPVPRHARVNAAVQELDKTLDQFQATPRVTTGQRVRPEEHDRAHRRAVQRVAHPGGVAAHQVVLECGALTGLDHDVGQTTEAGRDAVYGLAGRDLGLDERSGGADRLARGIR